MRNVLEKCEMSRDIQEFVEAHQTGEHRPSKLCQALPLSFPFLFRFMYDEIHTHSKEMAVLRNTSFTSVLRDIYSRLNFNFDL